tara:strand:+ start:55 stop:684 length:630 start_codon:yes stop_codon:yes gene_type:complete
LNTSFFYLIKKPENNTKKSPIVFLLHGFGSNEEDLFSFSPYLNNDVTIISLRAPIMLYPNSYAWYNIYYSGSVKSYDKEAAKLIKNQFISEMNYFIKKYDCDPNRITLIGFSQGAILGHAIAQSSNIKNLIALSGYVDDELINFDNTNKTSIYISHGNEDEVIPFKESIETNKILNQNNIEYEFNSFEQGHGVNSENLKSFLEWLKERY